MPISLRAAFDRRLIQVNAFVSIWLLRSLVVASQWMQPMSDRSSRNESWQTAFPKLLLDALGPMATWHPQLMAMTKANGHLAEGFATIFSEWQTFLGHRIEQDFLLWQNVAKSTSPQDVVAVQADFWQKAIANYSKECATIGKLLAGIGGKVISQAHEVSLEADQASPPSKRAA